MAGAEILLRKGGNSLDGTGAINRAFDHAPLGGAALRPNFSHQRSISDHSPNGVPSALDHPEDAEPYLVAAAIERTARNSSAW